MRKNVTKLYILNEDRQIKERKTLVITNDVQTTMSVPGENFGEISTYNFVNLEQI